MHTRQGSDPLVVTDARKRFGAVDALAGASSHVRRGELVGFHAWALGAYRTVFWRDVPLRELWPQLTVLATLAVVFLLTSRWLARRWETT